MRLAETSALASALLVLWSLTHHIMGLSGDGELYAIQALARVTPSLSTDIFLRGASQDNYTLFSPFYALVIGWFGVGAAAIALTVVVKIWFYSAAWALVRAFQNRYQAFTAVALLIVVKGAYGAYAVFEYSEDFLTARSVAEALIMTALAFHYRGRKFSGLLIALFAMLIHPLIALPGLLLLLCIRVPLKHGVVGAAGGLLMALGIAYYGSLTASSSGLFAILDPPWLEIVRERSQFLFPQLWTSSDWTINSRPFLSLGLGILASRDLEIKRLCWAAMLVGFTGIGIAFIAGAIGPVAILLQGQAWRWLWVPAFTSVTLLFPTVVSLWRDETRGPLCALLLILGWTVSAAGGLECLIPAIVLSLASGNRHKAVARYAGWAAHGLFNIVRAPTASVISLFYKKVRHDSSLIALLFCSATFAATAAIRLPETLLKPLRVGATSEIEEFQDWRAAIPAENNVYLIPENNSARFAWFTLGRPSYLSLNQSSGVVFSRETALEVKRRSQVLLPVRLPDWKLLTAIKQRHDGFLKNGPVALPLTRESLAAICSDPQLGFVVAKSAVGFEHLTHAHAGKWKDWNLYDCRRIRSTAAMP